LKNSNADIEFIIRQVGNEAQTQCDQHNLKCATFSACTRITHSINVRWP